MEMDEEKEERVTWKTTGRQDDRSLLIFDDNNEVPMEGG